MSSQVLERELGSGTMNAASVTGAYAPRDVIGFYAALGHQLPDRAGGFAPTRCLMHPERHRNGDRSPSAGVSTESGVHYCHGCGASTSPWSVALRFLSGDRRRAWDLLVRYGLRGFVTSNEVTTKRLDPVSGHFVTACDKFGTEADLLAWIAAYRRGDDDGRTEPVPFELPDRASEERKQVAGLVALLVGHERAAGSALLLSIRTAVVAAGWEPTDANVRRMARIFADFREWGTFKMSTSKRRPGQRYGTTRFAPALTGRRQRQRNRSVEECPVRQRTTPDVAPSAFEPSAVDPHAELADQTGVGMAQAGARDEVRAQASGNSTGEGDGPASPGGRSQTDFGLVHTDDDITQDSQLRRDVVERQAAASARWRELRAKSGVTA